MLRKDLPYNVEIAPRRNSIGLFCHNYALKKNLRIRCTGPKGKIGQTILSSEIKESKFTDLLEGEDYWIKITQCGLKGIRYKPKTVCIRTGSKPYIVLIGASVGYAWNIPEINLRTGSTEYVFGYRRGKEGFDKTNVLSRVLSSEFQADVIIIKECAAYFPRDVSESMRMIKAWVKMIQAKEIIPVLATVVPITQEREQKKIGTQKSINEFNNCLREYANENNLEVLDLQKSLDDGTEGRYLRNTYANPDGLHLRESTYLHVLDPFMISLTRKIFHKH